MPTRVFSTPSMDTFAAPLVIFYRKSSFRGVRPSLEKDRCCPSWEAKSPPFFFFLCPVKLVRSLNSSLANRSRHCRSAFFLTHSLGAIGLQFHSDIKGVLLVFLPMPMPILSRAVSLRVHMHMYRIFSLFSLHDKDTAYPRMMLWVVLTSRTCRFLMRIK